MYKTCVAIIYVTVVIIVVLLGYAIANAQQERKSATEHTQWYTAPRSYQNIVESPTVNDVRVGPEASETIDLGSPGGSGAGALQTFSADPCTKGRFGSTIPAHGLAPDCKLPTGGYRNYYLDNMQGKGNAVPPRGCLLKSNSGQNSARLAAPIHSFRSSGGLE